MFLATGESSMVKVNIWSPLMVGQSQFPADLFQPMGKMKRHQVGGNVVRTIINYPPVITINRWYVYHSQMGGLLLFSAKLVDFQAPNHFQSVDFSNRWAPPGTKLSETIQYAALAVGSDRCDAQRCNPRGCHERSESSNVGNLNIYIFNKCGSKRI